MDVGTARVQLPRSDSVLILVDFINPLQFEGAERLGPEAVRAAAACSDLKRRMMADGCGAIYANDNYGIWISEFSDVLGRCLAQPGPAGEIARRLRPLGGELTILKPRHSAFYGTPLELLLTQMRAKHLVFAGLTADICVQISVMDAFVRGYRIWVPPDCTAAEAPERKQVALDYMGRVLRCDLSPSR